MFKLFHFVTWKKKKWKKFISNYHFFLHCHFILFVHFFCSWSNASKRYPFFVYTTHKNSFKPIAFAESSMWESFLFHGSEKVMSTRGWGGNYVFKFCRMHSTDACTTITVHRPPKVLKMYQQFSNIHTSLRLHHYCGYYFAFAKSWCGWRVARWIRKRDVRLCAFRKCTTYYTFYDLVAENKLRIYSRVPVEVIPIPEDDKLQDIRPRG